MLCVLDQSFSDYEIIIVDDNSDEKIAAETKKAALSFEDKRITYCKTPENMGGALARNFGAKRAKGVYLAFLDDDDRWSKDKLSKQVELFTHSSDPDLAFVYCRSRVVDEKGRVLERSNFHPKGQVYKAQLMSDGIARTPAVLLKKEAFDKAEGFRNLFSRQEYDLFLRIFEAGYTADYVDEELFTAVIHSGERITTGRKKIEGEIMCYENRMVRSHILSRQELKKVRYAHFNKMCDLYIMVDKDYKNGLKSLLKTFLYQPFKLFNYAKLVMCLTHTYRLFRKFGYGMRK
jgi:glycosyltransferase involved in cell wall biosynthesis